jgi:preprotein translocase subunit SecA
VTRWLFRYRDTPALHALAIASCLFDQHPCDLPAGSKVYNEQRLAALNLVEKQNVQMDTGEGKTYAIALSAVGLLAQFPQVLVITANQYLAHRDLSRVRPFFEAAGLACGYGTPDSSFRGVSYLTIDSLCFEYMRRTYSPADGGRQTYPAAAAIIIDEIDSVLLDRNLQFDIVRPLPTEETLWKEVFDLADTISEDQYSYNPVEDAVALTADAWERVAGLSGKTGKPVSMLIDLVTAALWASRAQEGRNYVVQDGQIQLINRETGARYQSAGSYSKALEHRVLGANPAVSLSVTEINGMTLLGRHSHVVGLSGTARDDTLYYLLNLGTVTGKVSPRFPRHAGQIVTMVSPSPEHTLDYVAARIEDVSPSPVVIGTWSPDAARSTAEYVAASGVCTKDQVAVITSFDSDVDQRALDMAGQPGRVTVLSQGGSRGVDVRSQHRPLLIVLGRAYEPRLDRQFLGRVGRHGEPFDAEFVLDPNSPIWPKGLSPIVNAVGQVIPLGGGGSRVLRAAQRDSWAYRTQARQQRTLLSRAIGESEQAMATAFARAQQLTNPQAWSTYVTELFSEGEVKPQASGPDAQPMEVDKLGITRVIAAIERRQASDILVERFEAAVRAADPVRLGTHRQRTVLGPADELKALTGWVERRTGEVARSADWRASELFRRQVTTAAAQRLPTSTSPHSRSPGGVVQETLLMANASMIEQVKHRLEALRVSASPAVYYRRGAYTVQNVHNMVRLIARQDLLQNLSIVDTPEKLDDLFYSAEHEIKPAGGEPYPTRFELFSTSSVTDNTSQTVPTIDELIRTFLSGYEQRPGGLPIPEQSARVLLQTVLRPFIGVPGPVTGPLLRRQVDLVVQGLAAAGTRGTALRDHEELIEALLAHLFEKGILPVSLPRRRRGTGALGRAWTFASTVPRLGTAALVILACVLSVAFLLPPPTESRQFEIITAATQLFGFGTVAVGAPILTLFALIVVTHVVLRAASRHPAPQVTRVAPLLALGLTLAMYARGLTNLGGTVLVFSMLMLWAIAFFTAERFVLAMVGVQGTSIVGAASVLVYAITTVLAAPGLLAPLAVGVVAAAAGGPPIPVIVGSSTYARGRVRYANERTQVRVPLDPTLLSCLIAAVIVALAIGVRGTAELLSFAVAQVLVFGLLAGRRLNVNHVEGLLARLRVGTPLSSDRLAAHLRRALIASILIAAAATVGSVWLTVVSGAQTLAAVALSEWAGMLLVEGVLSIGNALSVSGMATSFLPESDADRDSSPSLRERLRAWRQLRFARLVEYGFLLLLLTRPLEWIADWTGLADAAKTVWTAVSRIFS